MPATCQCSFLFLIIPPPPLSTLFPYTTLFRSPFPAESFRATPPAFRATSPTTPTSRSEEHTSELQSHSELVCPRLLESESPHSPSPAPTPTPAELQCRRERCRATPRAFRATSP